MIIKNNKFKKLQCLGIIAFIFLVILIIPKARSQSLEGCYFTRGDTNGDSKVLIDDAIFTLNYLFLGGQNPACQDAADTNDDGILNPADVINLLSYLFLGSGIPPGMPFPNQGIDIKQDGLICNGLADNICNEKIGCGFGKVMQKCACDGEAVTDGYCCFNSFQKTPCTLQVYAQSKILEGKIDNDITACIVKKTDDEKFAGCGPFYSDDKVELRLTLSNKKQINPSYYNGENTYATWEESENGIRKIYLCNLNNFKKEGDCDKDKILIANGFNPSIGEYLVWEDESSILVCNPSITTGIGSCSSTSNHILLINKDNSDTGEQEFATPLIKGNSLLYRDRVPEGYNIYKCNIINNNCDPLKVNPEETITKSNLQKPGDIIGGLVVFASEDRNGEYTIYFSEGAEIKILEDNTRLVSSPQIVKLKNIELAGSENYYAVWKEARSGIKETINIKQLSDDPSALHYKIITPGYTGINGPSLFCEQDICIVQDKIIGEFEDASLQDNENFINKWFTCDLTSLKKPDINGIFGGCIRRL